MGSIFKKALNFSIAFLILILFSGCSIALPIFNENFEVEQPVYTVTLTTSTGGTVSGAGTYVSGSNVTITATSNDNYEFVSWNSGDIIVSTNSTYSFVISGNVTLTAYFQTILMSSYTVSIRNTLNGTVSGAGTYDIGTLVVLEATPNIGYNVSAWIINDVIYKVKSSIYVLTIDKNYIVKVVFILDNNSISPIIE